VTTGRGGKGTVFTVSNGNSRQELGDGNNAELQNSRYVIAVAAMAHDGTFAVYSSPGANLMITAPAGNFEPEDVIATDITGDFGFNGELLPKINNKDYTSFNGTSAAAPFVAGVVALMLEANPNLTPRDVAWILAHTGQQIDPKNTTWQKN